MAGPRRTGTHAPGPRRGPRARGGSRERPRAGGAAAAPWTLERDLVQAIDVLLGGLTDPPDPAALVEARVRRVRRRGLVLGVAAATAAVGGVAAAVALRDAPASPAAVALPATTDRAWASTSLWPTRGPLAADPHLVAFPGRHAARGHRVIWAGDLGTRRLVVLWSDDDLTPGATGIRLFTGPRGVDLDTLAELDAAPVATRPSTASLWWCRTDRTPPPRTGRCSWSSAAPWCERASYSPVLRPTVSR